MLTSGPVLLFIPTHFSHFRGIMRGVRRNTDPRVWLLPVDPSTTPPEQMSVVQYKAAIATVGTEKSFRALQAAEVPVVNVSALNPAIPLPRVGPDDRAVGEMAAKYFLARGFRHYGFFGFPAHGYSQARLQGYREALAAAGFEVAVGPTTQHRTATAGEEMVLANAEQAAWLRSAPKPLALFCATDGRGRRMCDACRQAGLRVPEDVAILGVDNDDMVCELASPPLSSVALPSENIGFEAAAMLARLMAGETVEGPLLLPPMAVMTRKSSDLAAVADDDVAKALEFIRTHAVRRHLGGGRPAGRAPEPPVARAQVRAGPRADAGRGDPPGPARARQGTARDHGLADAGRRPAVGVHQRQTPRVEFPRAPQPNPDRVPRRPPAAGLTGTRVFYTDPQPQS
jgi:LacI family transcriptional regulator